MTLRFALAPLAFCLLLAGCFSLRDDSSRSVSLPSAAAAKAAAGQKVQNLKDKTQFSLPDTLGGVVSSDRWVVYQEREEEEFEGNVSYDGGLYAFRCDYALSQRKKNLFTARGNVWARKNEPQNAFYELSADRAVYNYQTGRGEASARKGKNIELTYQNAQGALTRAFAQRAEFDVKERVYRLIGGARVVYTAADGQQITLRAQQITAREKDNYAVLEGGAEVNNGKYSLRAQTLEYDGNNRRVYAHGSRPLAQGKTEDGTFAIIADKADTETDSRKIHLSGGVQGWVVSEQVNASKANRTF